MMLSFSGGSGEPWPQPTNNSSLRVIFTYTDCFGPETMMINKLCYLNERQHILGDDLKVHVIQEVKTILFH